MATVSNVSRAELSLTRGHDCAARLLPYDVHPTCNLSSWLPFPMGQRRLMLRIEIRNDRSWRFPPETRRTHKHPNNWNTDRFDVPRECNAVCSSSKTFVEGLKGLNLRDRYIVSHFWLSREEETFPRVGISGGIEARVTRGILFRLLVRRAKGEGEEGGGGIGMEGKRLESRFKYKLNGNPTDRCDRYLLGSCRDF